MSDNKQNFLGDLNTPSYGGAIAVTPSDTVSFAKPTKGLWVGGVGAVSVVMLDGSTVIFSAVPAGTLLPIRVRRVNAAGTGATLIVALY